MHGERLAAEHGIRLDVGSGVLAERDAVADGEGDEHLPVVEADVGDLADVDAGEGDGVAGYETAGVDEVRRVGQAPGEELQLVVLQAREHRRGGDGQADDADLHGIAFTDRTHSIFAHLPVVCSADVKRMVVPSGPENLNVLAHRKNWKKLPYTPTRMSFL